MAQEPQDKTPPEPGSELSPTAREMRSAAPYMAAVWKLVGGAVVGVLGGYWLDRWWGTQPWLLVGLSLVGICVGFYAFLHEMTRLGKKR
ncbi:MULTISPECIES: AtpZ/AtpI family protein [Stigmatella]|uniref:ATP synthase protein I n=2 Tax=Stigmatella TaxID=40 RepID=A0A1H8AT96_STIAU|nr:MULTISPECIES: AtpZ/AtpI family protein [Stigmatella]SEM73935.1 ATP synthase protein I [Stigmatella aurantiaca]SEU36100.1 ATP synthase protein I [Stigmatella erecta]